MDFRVNHLLNREIEVTHEGHGSIGNNLNATRETPVGHEVLHDLDGVLILNLDPAYLVKSHCVPVTHQPDLMALIVVEQRRLGCLATADQRRVRREFAEEIGLTGTTRPQLDEVVVGLDERSQTSNKVQLHPR
ncbi:hypothetical protein FQZ97_947720 [compost metagenome]